MPRGDKSKYTDKQKRMAEHIEDSIRARGDTEQQAERIGWATVNKYTGGGLEEGLPENQDTFVKTAQAKPSNSKRTGPAKTTGTRHKQLSHAGMKGAARAGEIIKEDALEAKSESKTKKTTSKAKVRTPSTKKKGGK